MEKAQKQKQAICVVTVTQLMLLKKIIEDPLENN
jgi:hypothetical protein